MTQPIVEEKSLVKSTYKKETNLSNHLKKHYVKMQYNISIHIHRYKTHENGGERGEAREEEKESTLFSFT